MIYIRFCVSYTIHYLAASTMSSACMAVMGFGLICFGIFIFMVNDAPSGYLFGVLLLLTGTGLLSFAIRMKRIEQRSAMMGSDDSDSATLTLAGTIPALDPTGDITTRGDAAHSSRRIDGAHPPRRTRRSSDDPADLPDLEIDPPRISTSIEPGSQIDNTCKICYENASNVSMECGHIVCSACIEKIRGKSGEVPCPYCHMTIDPTKIRPLYFM